MQIFITGTDTDIGKTVISALLADYLRGQGINCGYLKLVSCGGAQCDDCGYVQAQARVPVHNVYHFPLPASPHLAAEEDDEKIKIEQLDCAMAEMTARHDVLLIEGAGGVLVPLTRSLLFADYMASHGAKALVVARSGLGTINHTLLTLECLQQRGIATLGVVCNDEQVYGEDDFLVTDNQRTIHECAGVPVFGRVKRFESWGQGRETFQGIGMGLMNQLGI